MDGNERWWKSPWLLSALAVVLLLAVQTWLKLRHGAPCSQSAELAFALSADGRQLVYTGVGDGGTDLCLADLDRRTTRVLAKTPELELDPCFSRDGRRIVFGRARGEYDGAGLWLRDLATGREQQLTRGGLYNDRRPSFCADGQTIVFVRRMWRRDREYPDGWPDRIYWLRVGGKAKLAPGPAYTFAYQPQVIEAGPLRGKLLAGVLPDRHANLAARLIDAEGRLSALPGADDGTGFVTVTDDGAAALCRISRWGPDGNLVEPSVLVRIDLTTARRVEVSHDIHGAWCVSGDGRRVVCLDRDNRPFLLDSRAGAAPRPALDEPLWREGGPRPRPVLPALD